MGRPDWSGWARRPDGTRLAIQAVGRREAPALLLLPGQANSHHWWDRLRGDLAEQRLTITFDYRGTGTTQAPDGGDPSSWSTASFADDAGAVLAAVGRRQADVYATSMGGRVAQELAIRHPSVVRRLVLACSSPGGALAVERDDDVRRALLSPDAGARRRAMVDLFYTPEWVAHLGGYGAVPGDLLGDPTMTPEDRTRHLRVSAGHDAGDRLGSIACPTLVLHGTADRLVPSINAQTVADRVPDCEVELFPGQRHGFFDERSDIVTSRVRAFLDA